MVRVASLLCLLVMAASAGAVRAEQPWYKLPEPLPPDQYGNILISRGTSAVQNIPAVSFSHWRHRLLYTCRVCHIELEFSMKANTTEITEEKNLRGEFCGACHNDKAAFGHTKKNCNKCHNGDLAYGSRFFKALSRLPRDGYGNRVDWVKALKRKRINPKETIFDEPYVPIPFKRELEVDAKASMAPPAEFSHEAHTAWLDCSNCHPDIFGIKKNTTENFTMAHILEGKFCGYCHLTVAFPMDDCKRCHPKMRRDTR